MFDRHVYIIVITVCSLAMIIGVRGGKYSQVLDLFEDKLGGNNYSTDLRPVIDQSTQMEASISFSLIGIVAVDDVTQKFTINGYFSFKWKDELLRWDPADYGGVDYFHVQPSRIWRPRMVLLNSLEDEADPFGDDGSSTKVHSDGSVIWNPGGILLTTCELDMEKFPFDTQSCHLMMCVMFYHNDDLRLVLDREPAQVNRGIYGQNKGWTLEDMRMDITDRELINCSDTRSCLYINLRVKRRPRFSVITILLPLVFLSFLNIAVFLIPIDSQERITYAITVLLAISVMMGTVSTLVPQASDILPAITIYLFILLIGACVSVLATIWIEVLQQRHEHKQEGQKNQELDHSKGIAVASTESHVVSPDMANRVSHHSNVSDTNVLRRFKAVITSPQGVNRTCCILTSLFWFVASLWYFGVVMG